MLKLLAQAAGLPQHLPANEHIDADVAFLARRDPVL